MSHRTFTNVLCDSGARGIRTLGIQEPKSRALPLGDSPMLNASAFSALYGVRTRDP